ncbi:Na+/H+ antiporter NhaC family protein [bacterium]|nr:Na+/H+ antiporter NhaC family protein [bacterium]
MVKRFVIVLFLILFVGAFVFGGEMRGILPPLLAIALAFITKQVIISLFAGVWAGATLLVGFDSTLSLLKALFIGFFRSADTYIVNGLNETTHIMIVIFSLTIGGMVGVISRSGGMLGIVKSLSKYTDTPVKAQILTWFMGIVIFFDDYANSLIVGNTMRPVTDKMRISREKLSYIIDSTSAPVASVSILSTWIGYEVGLIGDAFGQFGNNTDPYMAFIYSLPYRFYAILLLVIMPVFIVMRRDFGSMYTAEKRAILKGEVYDPTSPATPGKEIVMMETPEDDMCKWYNAALPIGIMILATFIGIGISGYFSLQGKVASLTSIISAADSFKVLIWSSLIATIVAVVLVVLQKIETIEGAISAWVEGVKSMVLAMIILTLAWGLSLITKELNTAEYLSQILSDSLNIGFLPVIVFIIAALTSFATGTSWGSMAILFPTALPLVNAIGQTQSISTGELSPMLYATIGAILTGSIFGDHCSPISDTTIMASMSSHVNHLDHVRTQIPYVLLFGTIAIVFGYLPAGFGVNPYLLMLIQFVVAIGFILYFGKKLPEDS